MSRSASGRSAPRDAARDLLLASLNPNVDGFSVHADTDWERIPWDWLLERAVAHKVAALFVGRMDHHGFTEDVPPAITEKFRLIQETAADRTERAGRTLEMLADLYGRHSIPFFIVKGGVLAEQAYGDPRLRPFYDVDVVVPDEHMRQAEELLTKRGYFLNKPEDVMKKLRALPDGNGGGDAKDIEERLRRFRRERHRHLVLVLREDDPRLPVELHWHITRHGILNVDEAGLWEQVTSTVVSGVPVKTFNLEAMFLHTVVHAVRQSLMKFRLLHLCDVVWIIDRLGHKLNTPVLRELTQAWGAEQYVLCALLAAESVFPFPVRDVDRLTDQRSRWSQVCLRLAGIDPSLVAKERPRSGAGKFTQRLVRETFWDLAFRRPPERARRLVSDSIAERLSRLRNPRN